LERFSTWSAFNVHFRRIISNSTSY
jgi:hypothetical protein